jgi:hypothetical protein
MKGLIRILSFTYPTISSEPETSVFSHPAIETFSTYISRESITINTDDYPELQGMTEEEAKEYIKENAYDMAPPSDVDWADNLSDALEQQDTIREKITDNDFEIHFE